MFGVALYHQGSSGDHHVFAVPYRNHPDGCLLVLGNDIGNLENELVVAQVVDDFRRPDRIAEHVFDGYLEPLGCGNQIQGQEPKVGRRRQIPWNQGLSLDDLLAFVKAVLRHGRNYGHWLTGPQHDRRRQGCQTKRASLSHRLSSGSLPLRQFVIAAITQFHPFSPQQNPTIARINFAVKRLELAPMSQVFASITCDGGEGQAALRDDGANGQKTSLKNRCTDPPPIIESIHTSFV
ncbi:MAG TPA: hypothetical protein DD435_13670 [Cyanobacteria bacterium UBA8530]|nr:hypothetical protein [Cyanobacteria bacterium UBA8530]